MESIEAHRPTKLKTPTKKRKATKQHKADIFGSNPTEPLKAAEQIRTWFAKRSYVEKLMVVIMGEMSLADYGIDWLHREIYDQYEQEILTAAESGENPEPFMTGVAITLLMRKS